MTGDGRRAVELCVAESEDASVRGDQPVASQPGNYPRERRIQRMTAPLA
jgi:hypothetical protein